MRFHGHCVTVVTRVCYYNWKRRCFMTSSSDGWSKIQWTTTTNQINSIQKEDSETIPTSLLSPGAKRGDSKRMRANFTNWKQSSKGGTFLSKHKINTTFLTSLKWLWCTWWENKFLGSYQYIVLKYFSVLSLYMTEFWIVIIFHGNYHNCQVWSN